MEIESLYYSGYIDSYFLFELGKNNYVNFLCQPHYKHLYDKSIPIKTLDESLNRIQHFIDVINKMKKEFLNMFNDMQNSMNEEMATDDGNYEYEITMEDIDPILEKIKDLGIDSLTEQEKIILKKYTNK